MDEWISEEMDEGERVFNLERNSVHFGSGTCDCMDPHFAQHEDKSRHLLRSERLIRRVGSIPVGCASFELVESWQ